MFRDVLRRASHLNKCRPAPTHNLPLDRTITPSHSFRRFNTRFFLGDGSNVFGEPAATEELEDVGWHPIGRERLDSFRDVTRFMLARAIALRDGTASGAAPLFYWAKNARRIGVCREAVSAP
jgi:hypothetical protein